MPRENYSNLADDFQVFGMNEMEALDVFEKFLEMCVKRQITLKPSKVKLLFYEVDFYGWKLDVHGISPSERNVSPFRKMVEPKDMADLRHVCGLFNCFTRFIVVLSSDNSQHQNKLCYWATSWVGVTSHRCVISGSGVCSVSRPIKSTGLAVVLWKFCPILSMSI